MLSNAASSVTYTPLLYTLRWNLELDTYRHTIYRAGGQHSERGQPVDKGENIQYEQRKGIRDGGT